MLCYYSHELSRMPKFIDLTGKKIGRLLVVSRSERRPRAWWRCKCDCGNECVMSNMALSVNKFTSCGCWESELRGKWLIKHGHAITGKMTTEYRVWRSMRNRCQNPANQKFKDYGGRGVSVCERWHDFRNFLADMGKRPEGTEIDRIDNNGNYEPGNCRWTTKSSNNRNRRNNLIIEFMGEKKCLAEWAEILGISWHTLFHRMKAGWTIEKTFTTPVKNSSKGPSISQGAE